ncbi:MAG TPA: DUF4203 domain-containing protein [Verrucomicrobiae bacterium]|nr:DUF4203 domain-containing protein [Verrucomicrobiae bacterium]
MNNQAVAGQVSALAVCVVGVLVCFWGYRLLKVTLGLLGFIAGAYAGWQLGITQLHANDVMALVCAVVGGLIGMALYVWFYFLGVFLLGATAGAIVTAAWVNSTGHQAQPLVALVVAIAFGLIALVAQRFMIIIATAFSGAYLMAAGVWPFIAHGQSPSRVWLDPAHVTPAGTLGYAALALWLVVGIAGASFQFRAGPKKVGPPPKPQ